MHCQTRAQLGIETHRPLVGSGGGAYDTIALGALQSGDPLWAYACSTGTPSSQASRLV